MDLGLPIASVIPGVHGVVLSILARTERPLTGRAVASLTGGRSSVHGVNNTLRELAAHGIVRCEPAGRANLYTLNREHVAANAIRDLEQMRERLLGLSRDEVSGWTVPAVATWMFGSAARGDGTDSSDIDLLIV